MPETDKSVAAPASEVAQALTPGQRVLYTRAGRGATGEARQGTYQGTEKTSTDRGVWALVVDAETNTQVRTRPAQVRAAV